MLKSSCTKTPFYYQGYKELANLLAWEVTSLDVFINLPLR